MSMAGMDFVAGIAINSWGRVCVSESMDSGFPLRYGRNDESMWCRQLTLAFYVLFDYKTCT